MRIKITQKRLAAELRAREELTKTQVSRGIRRAVMRSVTLLQRITPVDRGMMKNAWRSRSVPPKQAGTAKGIAQFEITNDSPYAGIVERGARPHPVNREGVEAIMGWVARHFAGATTETIKAITWAIVRKLKTKGQEPTYFVRNALPTLQAIVKTEVERHIRGTTMREASGKTKVTYIGRGGSGGGDD